MNKSKKGMDFHNFTLFQHNSVHVPLFGISLPLSHKIEELTFNCILKLSINFIPAFFLSHAWNLTPNTSGWQRSSLDNNWVKPFPIIPARLRLLRTTLCYDSSENIRAIRCRLNCVTALLIILMIFLLVSSQNDHQRN